MLIHGSCHCGNIAFRLTWTPEPREIPARACDCSFCIQHGGVWTSCPTGALEIGIRDPKLHSIYAFGTKTADFHVCARCGGVPAVTSRIDGQVYAVVSVNAMNGIDASLLKRSPASFDGEGQDSRQARRKKGWTPNVRISTSVDA